jgi:hypothetical protein
VTSVSLDGEYDPPLATATLDPPYRYTLGRCWHDAGRTATFVMLNPSDADHRRNDPTVIRCIRIARAAGCNALDVVNLYAYQTPSPVVLGHKARDGIDIVGPHNDAALDRAINNAWVRGWPLIAAWGGERLAVARSLEVLARHPGARWLCLGTTKAGQPRHPLMLSRAVTLAPWTSPA